MRANTKLGAVTACTLWASAFVGVKYGLQFMPMFLFAGMRFILAGAMQLPFTTSPNELFRLALRPHTWAVAATNTFLLYSAFFYGLTLVPGAQSAIVIGASPLVAAWMAHWFMPNDKMNLRKHAALALGLSGIVLIAVARKPWDPVGRGELLGILILLCASVIGTTGNILVARKPPNTPAINLNSVQMLLGGMGLLTCGFVLETPPTFAAVPAAFWGTLVYLAFLSAAAFAIWFLLLQREKVSELNLWKFLVPVLGAIFAWVLLPEESPDLVSVLGMLLVAGGIFVANRKTWRNRKHAEI